MAKQIDTLCSEITLYNAWNIVKEKGATGGIECYARIEYIPPVKKKDPVKIAVV